MTSGWEFWETYYTHFLKKCLRLYPGTSLSLSKMINWIIFSFPHRISKILFLMGRWDVGIQNPWKFCNSGVRNDRRNEFLKPWGFGWDFLTPKNPKDSWFKRLVLRLVSNASKFVIWMKVLSRLLWNFPYITMSQLELILLCLKLRYLSNQWFFVLVQWTL